MMSISARNSLVCAAFCLVSLPVLHAQQPADDRPKPCVPLHPWTRQQLDQREALKLYALGLIAERPDRLLEALQTFEKAVSLDPRAAAVYKVLVPLYVALDRSADALQAARKTVALDPTDFHSWYLSARLLRAAGKSDEAIEALNRGLHCPAVKERPDLVQQMYYDQGVLYEQAKAFAKAAASFTKAARVLEHPDALLDVGSFDRQEVLVRAAETYERVGRLYLQAGKQEQAIAAFQKAQAANPEGTGRLNYNLAQVCKDQGKLADALRYVDAYLRLQPQGTEAYELKVAVLDQLGRGKEIVPWLEQASANDRRNVGLKLFLARQWGRARLTAQAERAYLELAESNPGPDVYRGLFGLYRDDPALGAGKIVTLLNRTLQETRNKDQGEAASAAPAQARAMLAVLRADAALSKDLVKAAVARLEDPELQQDTVQLLAALADRAEQLDIAERCYRRCLKGVSADNEAQVYGGLIRVLWKAHKQEEVVAVCKDGLRLAQAANRVLFHSELARALVRLSKDDEAVRAADEAVRLAADGDRFAMRRLRVGLLTQMRLFDKAEAECQALLKEAKEAGDVEEVRYVLANVYSTAGNYPAAEAQLQLILKGDPNNATACNDLGYIWADQNKALPEAEKLIRKALDLDREHRKGRPGQEAEADRDRAAYIDSLGWVLFRRGRCEEARQELERAIAMPDGDDPVLWDHLGDVYLRLQMPARAQSAWETSVRLFEQERRTDRDGHYEDVRRKLKVLETETQH